MKQGGGKNKGGAYERDIAKRLSFWISDNERGDLFRRTHSSGAIHTVSHRKGESAAKMAGDIMGVDPLVQPFDDKVAIECKHYKNIDLWGLITGKGNLIKFWEQTQRQAREAQKHPILIVKQNLKPELLLANWWFKEALNNWFGDKLDEERLNIAKSYVLVGEVIYIYLLKDILKLEGETFLTMLKRAR